MHVLCAIVAYAVTMVFVDFPLKITSTLFFLTLGFIMCLIYPLVKNVQFPHWFLNWYDYSKSLNNTFAGKIWKAWQP